MPPPPRRRTVDEIAAEAKSEERAGLDITWPQAFAIAAIALALSASEIARYVTYSDRVAAKIEASKHSADMKAKLESERE